MFAQQWSKHRALWDSIIINQTLINARADDNGISLLLYFVFYLFILQCEYSFDTFVSASLPAVTESTASPDEMGESF